MKKKSFSVIIAIILSGIIFAPFSVRAEEIETYTQTGDAVSPVISDHTIEKLEFNDNDLFVNPRTKEEIKEYVKAHPSNNSSAVTFDIEPSTKAPYSLGRISEQSRTAALNMLNNIRYIAGLSEVTNDYQYEELAQAATIADAACGQLTHTPEKVDDMDQSLYELGSKGAGSSNLAYYGSVEEGIKLNESILELWTGDSDDGNISHLGHRRWVLSIDMKKVGFGASASSTATYTAMYAFDGEWDFDNKWVTWPAQTMPVGYFNTVYSSNAWSISTGCEEDISKVNVKLTKRNTGEIWRFNNNSSDGYFNVDNNTFGRQVGCIIFRPDDITKYTAGEIFDVEITGTVSGTISYTVTFVSINPITKITLDRDSLVLKQGEESQLNAEIAPYDADDVSLNWVSSNKDVATVEDGHITALSAGETSITVSSADGSVSATCLVKVKDRYTVKFNTNGGSEINSQIIDEDETVTEPFEPIKNGYNFRGWYQDEALTTAWDFSMPVTGDMTLYAKWELIIDKTVMVGKKITFRTSRKIKIFTVSEKGIVNVSKSGKKMIVKGKKPGIVTVVAYDKNGYEVGSWVVEVKPRQ